MTHLAFSQLANYANGVLKPQDVLVTLKLLALPPETVPTYPELAADLCMSVSETHAAVRRACRSRLLLSEAGKAASLRFVRPCLPALAEFLCGGLRYVFPAEVDGTAV